MLYYSHRKGYPRPEPISGAEFRRKNLGALPAFAMPAIVLGGIYGGLTTVTEAAALSAVAALVISMGFYKRIGPSDILPLLAQAARNSAAIMIIIVMALAFGHYVTESGMAAAVASQMRAWDLQPWHFLVLVNLLLFALGMFLEVFSVLLIALPVLLPMLDTFGIDPIHFGMIIVINMELALLTPPVGLNLFILASITKAPLTEVIRGITPFAILLLILLIIIMAFPQLSLWLPNLCWDRKMGAGDYRMICAMVWKLRDLRELHERGAQTDPHPHPDPGGRRFRLTSRSSRSRGRPASESPPFPA